MTNNQATLHKLDQMRLHGMARALRTSLDTQGQWTADELLAHLVDAESDDRHERRLKRLLKAARFRYPAAIEEVDFALRRNLDQNQLLRLADCRWVGRTKFPCTTDSTLKLGVDLFSFWNSSDFSTKEEVVQNITATFPSASIGCGILVIGSTL